MVYDYVNKKIFLHGGADDVQVLNCLYEFDIESKEWKYIAINNLIYL